MTTILLYGEMADKFGEKWELAVSSVGEAIRAMEANRPGIFAYLEESEERGIDFKVTVNGEDQSTFDEVKMARTIKTLSISPIVRGQKSGVVKIIIGVVLIAAAIFVPGMGIAVFGIQGLTWGAVVASVGISMVIGGVAQLITGTPKAKTADQTKDSSIFGGPENTVAQGGPVPLVYGGPIIVGSQVISAGISSEDTNTGYVDPSFGSDPIPGFHGIFHYSPVLWTQFQDTPTYPVVPDDPTA